MIIDPVVEELHRLRADYMERFEYDFDAVVRDVKSRESENLALLVEPPTSPPTPGHGLYRPLRVPSRG